MEGYFADLDWRYAAWPSGHPYDWSPAGRGDWPDDQIDFHLDLMCGRVPKGRIGVDRYPAPGVNVICDLDTLDVYGLPPYPGADAVPLAGPIREGRLPFPDSSIESAISHHGCEHVGDGFIRLMDECYRVLVPGGPMRIIVPLFPSSTAVADPDHKRYFMEESFLSFCGTPGDTPNNCWLASFSVPYTKARFEITHQDCSPPTPPHLQWTPEDRREMRITLRAVK